MVTNFPTPLSSTVNALLGDASGLAIIAAGTGAAPTTASTFQHGCLYYRTDSGTGSNAVYQNTGSTAVPAWTLLDTGTALSFPTTVTDAATTTTTSFAQIMSAITSGIAQSLTAVATTTGILYKAVAAAATLTGAGRYFSANDGTAEVFGVGPNGHLVSTSTTSAAATTTIAVLNNGGISAAALTAGATDTCGQITTTGTQANSSDSTLTVTFGKAYQAAPKSITLTMGQAQTTSLPYISSIVSTSFVVGITKGLGSIATPTYYYQVIA